MKKILLFIFIVNYSLFAEALPTSIKSSVKSTSNDMIQLSSTVPAGRSGIVMHNYGNGLLAITHAVISLGGDKASIQSNRAAMHKNIPSIQTGISAGDLVVFGNFYNNALIIAPNQTAYRQIRAKFNRTWIHPDAFALDFMREEESYINMNSLKKFAKKNQIGLVLVVAKNKLLVIDPISKQIIDSRGLKNNSKSAMSPFYARFKQLNLSMFGTSDKTFTPYFQSIAGLK